MIILAWMKGFIFLWDKEEQGSLGGFGRNNVANLEMFFDKCLANIFFSGVKWIDLGNLGNESVLEVDGMIKWTVRRELFVCFLRENIGEVSAEFWNGNFLGFFWLE